MVTEIVQNQEDCFSAMLLAVPDYSDKDWSIISEMLN
jgi:hypothetical protein